MTDAFARLQGALSDRYRLERELGQGGMATVYLAEDRKLGRTVALKILKAEVASHLGGERFLREIEIVAKLTHPNILALYDCGEADGYLYFTMPYVEGQSLRDRLDRERQLPLEEALQIAREVADALAYAHGHGVIHRDVKPENILLVAGHAVVADFGIAKAVAAAGSARLTETGFAVGTPAYMSPEQATGSGQLDGRSDVYSLGCVLYEMLSGETPYTGPTPQAILAKKLSEPLPRISVVREAVGPGVEAVLAKALARNSADRWPTAAEFVAALAPPATVAVAAPVAPARLWQRRAARRAAVALVSVVVLAGAAFAAYRLGRNPRGAHYPHTAIAVLPLENLSAQGPHSYFAGGLHDELLTQLAKVAALKVIARTSVLQYEGTTKRLSQVAEELAVGSIVEGSVQVVGNRLRVNVQLIDPRTEAHVWADTYDRTLDDAFAVQSDIAQRIVGAVGAQLTTAEAGAIAAAPTQHSEAYRLYLQAEEYRRRPGYERRNLEVAQQLLERALALDPRFALAHASLGEVHAALGIMYGSPAEAYARLRSEAEAAVRLAPDLPQAISLMGRVRSGDPGLPGVSGCLAGRAEQIRALRGAPNDVDIWVRAGGNSVCAGDWVAWRSALSRARALDPRNVDVIFDLGGNHYWLLHRYGEAVAAMDSALALAPDVAYAKLAKGLIYLLWHGQSDSLRHILARGPEGFGPAGSALTWRVRLALWERRPDTVLALLRDSGRAMLTEQDRIEPAQLYVGWARRLRGDTAAAHEAFRAALGQLDSALRGVPDDPENYRLHTSRGLALAGLGRRAEAKAEADWLARNTAWWGVSYGSVLSGARAMILAQAGLVDEALPLIEEQLAGPSWYVSVPILRIDPRWDPIRHDPRFQALLVKYQNAGPVDR